MWQQKAYNSCPYTRARTREDDRLQIFHHWNLNYRVVSEIYLKTRDIFSKTRDFFSKTRDFFFKTRDFFWETRDFDWETIRLFDETKVSFSNNTEVDVSRCGNPPNKSTVFDLPLVLFS